jgi:hypothetical protein
VTAPTIAFRAVWLDLHRLRVDLPDGPCQVFYDWDRCGWTSDRPGACFQPVSATHIDALALLRASHC